MTTFQTKCPHCQHLFAITQDQLALKNGLARCGSCKQIFSAKDNLQTLPIAETNSDDLAAHVTNAPVIDSRDEVLITPATQKQSKATRAIDDEILFDDQVGLDDDADTAPLNHTPNNAEVAFDILDDFDGFAAPTGAPATAPTQTQIKNTLAAPKPAGYTAIEDTLTATASDDESWLEELLEKDAIAEKNQSYLASKKIDTQSNATDVSSLLSEFGVDIVEEKALEQPAYQQRLEQRFNHQPTAQQAAQRQPMTRTILWGIGSLLLLLGLGIQYAAFNQDTLIKKPSTAQALRSICDGLHLPCNLPYADPAAIDIKTLSFEGKDNSDIIISLTNRSSQSQIYPNLKITLQSNNTGIAQLIATPAQYLDDASHRLMPQQIKPIKLRINFPRDKADQVVIDPFY